MSPSSKDQPKREVYGKQHDTVEGCMRSDKVPYRLYDERLPPEPTYPSTKPSQADFGTGDEHRFNGGPDQRCQCATGEDLNHAPPGSSARARVKSTIWLIS